MATHERSAHYAAARAAKVGLGGRPLSSSASHRRRHRIAANRATDPVITGRKQVRVLWESVYTLSATFSTLSCQDRQRQDTGVEQLGIKNDKQRSSNNRSAVRLAVLFAAVPGKIMVRPAPRRGRYFLSRLSRLWCCCFPQPLGNRVQHRHVLIQF